MITPRFEDDSLAVCFPGQASQEVGMGYEAFARSEAAKRIFHIASTVLEEDLTEYCWGSKTDELDGPIVQPALGAAILAELEWRKEQGLRFDLVMGHSVSEIIALGAAGAISQADMFRILKVRGIVMDESNQENPGVMTAFIGSTREQLVWMMNAVNRKMERVNLPDFKVYPGMHNWSLQNVASGHPVAMERLERMFKRVQNLGKTAKDRYGFEVSKVVPVRVKKDGAAHTPYQEGGVETLLEEMQRIERKPPQIPILFNDGSFRSDPAEYPDYIAGQLVKPADWHRGLWAAVDANVRNFIEIEGGNKQVLAKFTKQEFPQHSVFQHAFGEIVHINFIDQDSRPNFYQVAA